MDVIPLEDPFQKLKKYSDKIHGLEIDGQYFIAYAKAPTKKLATRIADNLKQKGYVTHLKNEHNEHQKSFWAVYARKPHAT